MKNMETFFIHGDIIGEISGPKNMTQDQQAALMEALGNLMIYYQLNSIEVNWGLPEKYRTKHDKH